MSEKEKAVEVDQCMDCEGTGLGPCAECGDGAVECACENPCCDDCDTCEGSGSLIDEPISPLKG